MNDLETDGRKRSGAALEGLRRQAVTAVESGLSQVQVARVLGVSRKSVNSWVREYRSRGDLSFRSQRRGRRPGEQLALDADQQAAVLHTIVHGPPEQAGLDYPLWTRQAICELINRQYRISLSVTSVGNYLLRWGLPTGCGQLDELRAQALSSANTLWVAWLTPSNRHVLIANTNRGSLSFLASTAPFTLPRVLDFSRRLSSRTTRSATLVVCDWPIAHLDTLNAWVAEDDAVVLPS